MATMLVLALAGAASQPDLIASTINCAWSLIPVAVVILLIWFLLRQPMRKQNKVFNQVDESVALQQLALRRNEVELEMSHQMLVMQQEQIRLLKKIANEPGDPPAVSPLPPLTPPSSR